jgi:integrase
LGINQANYESGEQGRSFETQKYGGKCNGFLGRLSKKLGLDYKLHFHCARHTFATMALRSLPIEIVSKILGHSSIKMTERYAKVLEQDAIAGQEQFLRRVSGLFGD